MPFGQVKTAIESLKSGGMLFERTGLAGLRLWAARRVDMNALWREAETALHGLDSVAEALPGLMPPRIILARRHAIQTGTLRQFSLVYLSHKRLESHKRKLEGDGVVLVVFNDRTSDYDAAFRSAQRITADDQRLVIAILPPLDDLGALVLELRRAQWLDHHAGALRDDAFAAAELSRQIAWLETRIQRTVSVLLGLTGLAGEGVRLVWSGETLAADAPCTD